MEEDKKDELHQIKIDKYSQWLGIIENIQGEPELSDSNLNYYNISLLRKGEINTESLLLPIYVKSPSELDGLNESEENKIKFYLLLMMQEAGLILRVPQNTILTSQLIFNKFFWRVSLNCYEPFVIAMTSFYIGCKSEETYRRIRDVISAFYKLYSNKKNSENNEIKNKEKDIDNKTMINKTKISIQNTKEKETGKNKYEHILDISSDEFKTMKNNICFYEIEILKELGFSIYSLCDHPHKYLTHFIKHLKGTKELLQKSWNYLNDSYKTNIPIHYPPHVIACSAIFLAARNFKLPLPRAPWWEIYDTKIEEIQEICSVLLSLNELYSLNSICLIKFSEIRKILSNSSRLKPLFDQQEKSKLELIEEEKILKEKEKNKDKNLKESKLIKYEYNRKKRTHSRSRSRSKKRFRRSRSKDSYKQRNRKRENSYSDSSSPDNESDSEKSISESSSSIDIEKIKRRVEIKEKEKKKKRRKRSPSKKKRRDYSSSSSDYKRNKKYKRSKNSSKRKSSYRYSSESSSYSESSSDSSSN